MDRAEFLKIIEDQKKLVRFIKDIGTVYWGMIVENDRSIFEAVFKTVLGDCTVDARLEGAEPEECAVFIEDGMYVIRDHRGEKLCRLDDKRLFEFDEVWKDLKGLLDGSAEQETVEVQQVNRIDEIEKHIKAVAKLLGELKEE